jgi:hypothetical protein
VQLDGEMLHREGHDWLAGRHGGGGGGAGGWWRYVGGARRVAMSTKMLTTYMNNVKKLKYCHSRVLFFIRYMFSWLLQEYVSSLEV